MRVLITVPLAGPDGHPQNHDLRIDQIGVLGPTGGPAVAYMRPGEEREFFLHSGMTLRVGEVAAGTADAASKRDHKQ